MRPRRVDAARVSEAGSLRVGVSACLVGREVRFDGQHKRQRYVTDVLGGAFELVEVCPEVEAGFGTPREAMRLVGDVDRPRLLTIRTGRDLTPALESWSAERVKDLAELDLDGFVLKAKSPSCGMERVRVYGDGGGSASAKGQGIFARALADRLPLLPVEEEGRLHDEHLRESFVVRLFCHHRFRAVSARPQRRGELLRFHTTHKLLLMAHSEVHMRRLGRLVAGAGARPPRALIEAYAREFFEGMKRRATVRKHTNVLQHMAGHLRGVVDDWDAAELRAAIEDFRLGRVPRVVPLTLLRHHVDKHSIAYLVDQHYLRPHPIELGLLNHP